MAGPYLHLVLFGASYSWVAPILVAVLAQSRLLAGVIGAAGLAGLALVAARFPVAAGFETLYRDDRWLAVATVLVAVSPVVMLGYAVTGHPYALAAVILAGTAALVLVFVVRGDWAED